MRKLRKILCLLFIVGIVASMPFETAMAASRSEDFTTESASKENNPNVKQLILNMESGSVERILYNKSHVSNEYTIFVNDTYSNDGRKIDTEVYDVIRDEAIKNDIDLITIPIDGDSYSKAEFDNVVKYEKVESIEAEKIIFNLYNCSAKTNLGEIRLGLSTKSEIQVFASKYGLFVNFKILVKNTIFNICLVILILSCILSPFCFSKSVVRCSNGIVSKRNDILFCFSLIATIVPFAIIPVVLITFS